MGKKLVIVESPSKAKTIEKYLGENYKVKSSKGHVVDLPKSGLSVDVDNNYEPTYEVTKKSVIKDLKKDFKNADTLVLAVDPDREGEAIGWHVAQQLGVITDKGNKKKNAKNLERIVFTEITKEAVKKAANNPREIDMNLVNAQQARRILDRLVGYKLSPLLWKKIRYGLSAGRVQSVAVRLIVDRELEREKFNPEEYWRVRSFIETQESTSTPEITYIYQENNASEILKPWEENNVEFEVAKYKNKKLDLKTEEQAQAVVDAIKKTDWKITNVETKQGKKSPNPPFSTSALQQDAVNKLGISSGQTMRIAQKLYEAGHITYMRTDSISMSQQAVQAARKQIEKIGKEYLPAKPIYYKSKSKVAQEAHEAIRPTDFTKTAKSLGLDGQEAKLYELIYNRALSSQMVPAQVENTKAIVQAGDYILQATGKRVVFPGYLKIYPEKIAENVLPEFKEGQEVYPQAIMGTQHFTQPPARYSEATLVKELEKLGVGRPSTYAPIIQTIQQRKYVEKEGRYFIPTDTGRVVTNLLKDNFEDIVDSDFTAEMEDELDQIANGDLGWKKMLDDFYKPFSTKLEEKEEDLVKNDYTVLGDAPADMTCPECGGKMIIKLGRYGRFYSCQKFPDCKGMRSLEGETEEDIKQKPQTAEFQATYQAAPKTDDGRDYILKKGRFGEFWAHPDYPKVKDAQPLQLKPEILKERYGTPPKTEDGKDFVFRQGKYGPFWAHPDYPKKKEVVKIKQKE